MLSKSVCQPFAHPRVPALPGSDVRVLYRFLVGVKDLVSHGVNRTGRVHGAQTPSLNLIEMGMLLDWLTSVGIDYFLSVRTDQVPKGILVFVGVLDLAQRLLLQHRRIGDVVIVLHVNRGAIRIVLHAALLVALDLQLMSSLVQDLIGHGSLHLLFQVSLFVLFWHTLPDRKSVV